MGLTYWVLVGEIFTTCPPRRLTRGAYSSSGSQISTSSSVTRTTLVISRLAENDLPLLWTTRPFSSTKFRCRGTDRS